MTASHIQIQELIRLIDLAPEQDQRRIFAYLRPRFQIHQLEGQLNASAEVILEAISRASDLTLRGIRGIIAEAAFKRDVVLPLVEQRVWQEIPLIGDYPYDFKIFDACGSVTIQVKMQRQKARRVMYASAANKKMFGHLSDHYVVETQRTRGGKGNDGEDTRPYKFGEFDILAVALYPSSDNWSNFTYTVERWLVPTPGKPAEVFKFQPVAQQSNECWTTNLETAIQWLRSGEVRNVMPII